MVDVVVLDPLVRSLFGLLQVQTAPRSRMLFEKKPVLVMGGSSAIGEDIAHAFALIANYRPGLCPGPAKGREALGTHSFRRLAPFSRRHHLARSVIIKWGPGAIWPVARRRAPDLVGPGRSPGGARGSASLSGRGTGQTVATEGKSCG